MCKYLFLLRLIYRHLSSFGYTILSRLCIGSGYKEAAKCYYYNAWLLF